MYTITLISIGMSSSQLTAILCLASYGEKRSISSAFKKDNVKSVAEPIEQKGATDCCQLEFDVKEIWNEEKGNVLLLDRESFPVMFSLIKTSETGNASNIREISQNALF